MTVPLLGELHDIYLLHLALDPEEVRQYMPSAMPLRIIDGKAIMSLVNVQARHFRLRGMPRSWGVKYNAVMMRVAVDDAHLTQDGLCRGIHIPHIFLNRRYMSTAFGLTTDQSTSAASIETNGTSLQVSAGDRSLSYVADIGVEGDAPPDQVEIAENLDRAYTVSDSGQVRRITIARDKWPLQPIACREFKTNIFESADVLCLFKVTVVIPYEWSAFNLLYTVPKEKAARERSFAVAQGA